MINNSVLVTIGIPFYNNERTLKAAINSVLLQTYTHWELLLVNDGSTDRSLEIAQTFADIYPQITVINDRENKGLTYRLNQIIELAKGTLIARMDSDDMMMPERIEKQVKCLTDHATIDIVATAAYIIDQNNIPIGIRDRNAILAKTPKNVIEQSLLIHPSIMVRADWYIKNRYDPTFLRAEDYELWCRTFNYTNFYRLAEPLLIYREGNVNIDNYVVSMQTLRLILKKYGPKSLTNFDLYLLLFKTHLKSMLYKVIGLFNLQYLITKRRNQNLTKTEYTKIESAINVIVNLN